jgi:hypothetical protein
MRFSVGLRLAPLNLLLLEHGRDGDDDFCGHLILQIENVLRRSFESVGPEVRALDLRNLRDRAPKFLVLKQ